MIALYSTTKVKVPFIAQATFNHFSTKMGNFDFHEILNTSSFLYY